MELGGRVVVVTGGGSGIGAALCRRFVAEGARGVVVADRVEAAARDVAASVGGVAAALDVRDAAAIAELVARTERDLGPVDLFCSNAGVALGLGVGGPHAGPFASDEDWRASFDVNVMAHVHAARAVLPGMLARGRGALLQTASAAGLLADVGSCAYSVTKHAAVAFAEWLAITYGARGIYVACLCPQGVRTPMVEQTTSRGVSAHLAAGLLEPEQVADAVVAGLRDERFLILPHPEVAGYLERKAADPERWIAGMQRMRRRAYPDAE